ncbi:MAG: hypothetical protein IJ776_08885 [Paludibacteraceae bacterium]|nr:hypothetical protein [Paludibacteraceae bacterium]
MNLSDYIILLEDRLEEDMRGEYGVDLLRVSKEYLMMYAGDLQQNPVGMTYCHNGKCSSMYSLATEGTEDEQLKLVFDSYILHDEHFSISPTQSYSRGVSGYRGKSHDLLFSLVKKEGFVCPKDSSEYIDI